MIKKLRLLYSHKDLGTFGIGAEYFVGSCMMNSFLELIGRATRRIVPHDATTHTVDKTNSRTTRTLLLNVREAHHGVGLLRKFQYAKSCPGEASTSLAKLHTRWALLNAYCRVC